MESAVADPVLSDATAARLITKLQRDDIDRVVRAVRSRFIHETNDAGRWTPEKLQECVYEVLSDFTQRYESLTRLVESKK